MSEEAAIPSGAKAPLPANSDGGAEAPLLQITTARLSMGVGAVSTGEQLRFQMDHALARDAVHAELDVALLVGGLGERGLESLVLRSAVTGGRREYLRRPDLGRRLSADSARLLQELAASAPDVVFILADGLSAVAVERHALPLLDSLLPLLGEWKAGVVCVATQARVMLGDEIGQMLGAKLVVLMIGERPGLSSPDSLGVYLTWEPRAGRTEAERNCISNIRHEGLSYAAAASRIAFYMHEARRLQATGFALKEGVSDVPALPNS